MQKKFFSTGNFMQRKNFSLVTMFVTCTFLKKNHKFLDIIHTSTLSQEYLVYVLITIFSRRAENKSFKCYNE